MAVSDKELSRKTTISSTRQPRLISRLFCQHDWVKREGWHQPPRSEGKTAWKCGHCGKIISKPSWQLPDKQF